MCCLLHHLSLLEVFDELERALNLRHLDLHRLLGLVHVALHQLVLATINKDDTERASKRAPNSGRRVEGTLANKIADTVGNKRRCDPLATGRH